MTSSTISSTIRCVPTDVSVSINEHSFPLLSLTSILLKAPAIGTLIAHVTINSSTEKLTKNNQHSSRKFPNTNLWIFNAKIKAYSYKSKIASCP